MRLVVVEFMTLDGVMEAPGFEEHRSGRNGWAMRADDPELAAFNARQIFDAAALLFGRTTFNVWAAYWPTAPEPAHRSRNRASSIRGAITLNNVSRSRSDVGRTFIDGGLFRFRPLYMPAMIRI